MKFAMIVNAFLRTPKFRELERYLMDSAKRNRVSLSVFTNVKANGMVFDDYDLVLFWDKDILLATAIENQGVRVMNSSESIRICDNKGLTDLALRKAMLPIPDTILAPFTYESIGYTDLSILEEMALRLKEQLGYPVVVKECYGSFGAQVYLAKDTAELLQLTKDRERVPLLYQRFYSKHAGNDIRLQMVGKRCVAAMHRYSDKDFRANVSNGGQMESYKPTKDEITLATSCMDVLGLDFAGVDLIWDDYDRPMICEVNSNAHFVNLTHCTGISISDAILEYMLAYVRGEEFG